MIRSNTTLTIQKAPKYARVGSAGTLLICALFSYGQAFLFTPAFPCISLSPWILFLWGMAMSGIFLLMLRFRARRWVLPAGTGGMLLFSALFSVRLIDGIGLLYNDVIERLCILTGRIFLSVAVGENASAVPAALFFTALTALFIACAATFCEPALLLPLTLTGLAGSMVGLLPCNSGLAAIAAGTVFSLICSYQMQEKFRLKTAALPLAVLLPCILSVCIVSGQTTFSAQPLRENVRAAIHAVRFHGESPALPEGRLAAHTEPPNPDTPALEITFSKPEKTYLRGFIGEKYTGTAWKTLPGEEIHTAKDLFYTLHKNGFTGATVIAAGNIAAGNTETETLDVLYMNACARYLYLPYGAAESQLLDPAVIGDSKLFSDQKNHRYAYYAGGTADWFNLLARVAAMQKDDTVAQYLAEESAYRAYVKEHDLQLTDAAEEILSHVFIAKKPQRLGEITSALFQALETYLPFDETAPAPDVPKNGDYLTALLGQQTGGNCVQYATAATLMLRYLGLPARYVEGYLISEEDAAKIRPGEPFTVTESMAHAWAEYYVDGLGWLPLEVMPGISGNSGSAPESAADETPQTSYVSEEFQQVMEEYRQQAPTPQESAEPQGTRPFALPLFLLLLPLLLLAALILRARLALRKKLTKIKNAPDREAVLLEYAYAKMLLSSGAPADEKADDAAKQLNDEAFFSDHEMGEYQRRLMCAYRNAVLRRGLGVWKLPKKLFLRLIKGIY